MKPRLGDRQTSILNAIMENKRVNVSEVSEYARLLHAKAKKNERVFFEEKTAQMETGGSVADIVMGAMNEDEVADLAGGIVEKLSTMAEASLKVAFEENAPNYTGLEDLRDFDEEGVEEAEMIFVDSVVSAAYVYFESIANLASEIAGDAVDQEVEDVATMSPRGPGR